VGIDPEDGFLEETAELGEVFGGHGESGSQLVDMGKVLDDLSLAIFETGDVGVDAHLY